MNKLSKLISLIKAIFRRDKVHYSRYGMWIDSKDIEASPEYQDQVKRINEIWFKYARKR